MSEPEPEPLEPSSAEPEPESELLEPEPSSVPEPGPAPEPLAPWTPTAENPGLDHDPAGRVWERHTEPGASRRDRDADRETRKALAEEQHYERNSDGTLRRSNWGSPDDVQLG